MPYNPITNFQDNYGGDLGKNLVTKDYLLSVYPTILDTNIIGTTPNLWVWGNNVNGNLAVNDNISRSTPVTTFFGGTNWQQVSGDAAIKTDGTLWMWGLNDNGQLGVNDIINRSTPVTTILGGTNWSQIAYGSGSMGAIKTDGTLWVWGTNLNGQLGINLTGSRSIPVTTFIGGNNWKSVSVSTHYAAIKTDGSLWVWGFNSSSSLGLNDNTTRLTPVTTWLGGNNWKFASCNDNKMAAIKTDGTLWNWGLNTNGQLGVNDITTRSTPVTTILGGNNWKFASVGAFATAAIKTDGTLWTWGTNANGQLGVNDIANRSTPVTTILGGINWKFVCCTNTSVYTIKTDGTLWNWGANNQGQQGVNDVTDRRTPVTTILGGTNWKSISPSSNIVYISAIQSVDDI